MDIYEATFEIKSQPDANAVERVLTRLYDSLREESRTVRNETSDSTEMLAQFEAIRAAAADPAPGSLTVIYKRKDESFEE